MVLVLRFALYQLSSLNGALCEPLNLAENLVSLDIQKLPRLQFEGFLSTLSNFLLFYLETNECTLGPVEQN